MTGSKTSVVIPTYNGSRFIREAIESVLAQTLPPDEIIVVDDRSTDSTCEVVSAIAETSPIPLRLIRLEQNSGGPSKPTNVGVQAATGDIIAVLDQDDVFHPEKLARQVPVLANNPDYSLVFSWSQKLGANDCESATSSVARELEQDAIPRTGFLEIRQQVAIEAMLRYGTFVKGYPGFIFRREDFLAKGGADESLRIAGDLDLISWLAIHARVALVPFVCYSYREHESNACRRRAAMWIELARVWTSIFDRQPELRSQRKLVLNCTKSIAVIAWWFREGGCYSEALEAHLLLRKLGVARTALAVADAKVWLHRACTSVGLRKTVDNSFTGLPATAESLEVCSAL
ncbi:MAG: glycosyltransferase [Planctomycetota bacterium]|nr:glycosyltransferase [Planctomycetota bacterium]